MREFLSQVSPELLQSIPRNAWETTVGWGSASVTAYKQADHLTELSRDEPDFITVKATNSFSVSGKTVTLGASNTVVDPLFYHVPAMSVYCFLLEDGLNIFTHGDYDTDVWRVTSRESYAVSGGAYYQNMSYHFVDYPVGYYPPTIFWIKYSSTRWINE
ncbi:hypothetical protein KKG90_00270 [Candidatus Bipolaricaulota bacterium]|nr:hypothetical protein [Candidatus Bipolaricaulota bacterium]